MPAAELAVGMDSCATCGKPAAVCVCDRTEALAVRARVVVLQHPQEQDRELGTVPILAGAIGAAVRVGLSWPNLAQALGEAAELDPRGWVVLWPSQLPRALTDAERTTPAVRIRVTRGPHGEPAPLSGLIALDGTWSQAKTLWWRNPWLMKLDRVVLHPANPSIYGRLRREPRRGFLSTLESVAEALVEVAGEDPAVRTSLHRTMRTMVQRARDAGIASAGA